ncbi:MAG: 3'(2'),5'-bisphosphate nucleotidase CysQ [Gammaproteobacteria bacterium]|nr:3'(2'),5'-bisphosphate nucleotidase CysQ [Gammaproteobacteria bacterium]|tara:strand:+ start:173 stop:988 length:816 start_codon:yes stop_codon:yes gene_type:complete
MLPKNLESIISQLEELTRSLFPKIIKIYQNPGSRKQQKKDGSPVTAADIYAHKVIVRFLESHFSNIPIVSEEGFKQKNYEPTKEFWIIDPIDGTKEFVNQSDEFTTNIALIQNGKPLLGVVGAPAFDKVWSGIAIQSKNKIKPDNKKRSMLRIVMSKSHRTVIDKAFLNFLNKKGKKLKIISKGSSLKICALADKKADIYPRFGPTSEWDIAAADAVLRSRGGGIFQIDSYKPLEYGKKNSILNPMFIAISDLKEKKTILSLIGSFKKNLL